MTTDAKNPPTTLTEESSFLTRWSRRKSQARISPEQSLPAETSSVAPEKVLTDADMPPLESLDEHSDYSGFFSGKVSAELRRLALRKLFHSPRFNVSDGLNDYDEDFTQFAGLGKTITREMRHRLEMEAKRLVMDNHSDPTPAESPHETGTTDTSEAEVDLQSAKETTERGSDTVDHG